MEKKDCSNIFNFMSEWERRRKSDNTFASLTEILCRYVSDRKFMGSSIKTLQKWSDEHPIKTRKEKFIQMCNENGFNDVPAYHIKQDRCEYPCCIGNCAECEAYWNSLAE